MSGEMTTEIGSLDDALDNLEEMDSSSSDDVRCKNCAKPPSKRRIEKQNIKSGQAHSSTEDVKLVPACPECGEWFTEEEDERHNVSYQEWKDIAKTQIKAMVDRSDSGHPFSLNLYHGENALVRPPRDLPTNEIVAYVMNDEVHLFEIHQDSPKAVLESLKEVQFDHYPDVVFDHAIEKLEEIDDSTIKKWCRNYPYGEKVVAGVALIMVTGDYHYKVNKYIGDICPEHRLGQLRSEIGYEYPG